jgi:hypothetical protein
MWTPSASSEVALASSSRSRISTLTERVIGEGDERGLSPALSDGNVRTCLGTGGHASVSSFRSTAATTNGKPWDSTATRPPSSASTTGPRMRSQRQWAFPVSVAVSLRIVVDDVRRLPVCIANTSAARSTHPALFVTDPERAATEMPHTQRIRAYVGCRASKEEMSHWAPRRRTKTGPAPPQTNATGFARSPTGRRTAPSKQRLLHRHVD